MEKAIDEKELVRMPETGLEVRDGWLVCQQPTSEPSSVAAGKGSPSDVDSALSLASVSRHRLGEIDSVELSSHTLWGMLALSAALWAGGAYEVYLELEPRWLAWSLTIGLGLVGLMLGLGSHGQTQTINTPYGRVDYDITDSTDVYEGFAVKPRSYVTPRAVRSSAEPRAYQESRS